MRNAVISGTGSFVPARVVTNAELSAVLGEDIDDFVSGTLGIRERRWCDAGESTADLAEAAARAAMDDAGIGPRDVDLLIVSTDTPEYISPATASVLHGRMGMRADAGTFDLNSACAGFATALDVAWKYLRALRRPMVEAWARDQALGTSYTDLLLHPEVAARVQAAVDGVNAALSRPEQIRRWILLDRDLSPEEEELTPTLKLRRAVVEAKFRDRLDALYS